MTTITPNPPFAVCALCVQTTDDKTRLIPAGTYNVPRGAMEGRDLWHLDAQGAAAIIELAATRPPSLPSTTNIRRRWPPRRAS